AGHDPQDSTCIDTPVPDYSAALNRTPAGLKIGLPKEYFTGGLDPQVEAVIRRTAERLQKAGAQVVEVSLPHSRYAVAAYYIVATAEASSNLERYDGARYGYRASDVRSLEEMYVKSRTQGFGTEVKRRIMLGTYVLSAGYYDAYYLRAQKVRTLIKRDFDVALQQADCLLAPTAPTTAFRLNEKLDDPLSMYLSDVYTVSVNLAGLPALSVPAGTDTQGLPVGAQLIAKPFDEETLFCVGQAIENAG
ncbi:Asp-tRNA(Asn)/Glu-tRNA(Gln) amidotransferase subunit GatA, partial [candidate division KSB1 bacterium]|nr:Asp-tRNA(Asn)/Glu-tRNA(Gln) amidotransferase subunit GatA [candidate division KSB1 bacterium]